MGRFYFCLPAYEVLMDCLRLAASDRSVDAHALALDALLTRVAASVHVLVWISYHFNRETRKRRQR